MNTKEIIDEINSGKYAIFEKPVPSVRPNGLKFILVFVSKSNLKDIEQPYWIFTRELYKNGEISESRLKKVYYTELERRLKDLNKMIKERNGRILIKKSPIIILHGHLFLSSPGLDDMLDEMLDEYYD